MHTDHMTYRSNAPRGMVLKCRFCGWRPADDVTIGAVAEHFKTEPGHGDGAVTFDLVVICPRCDKPMVLDRIIRPGREQYACPAPCYRTRVVTRRT